MIPWVLSDTNYVRGPHQRLDTSWTVFVGGLHGMLNAGMLTYSIKFEILSKKVFWCVKGGHAMVSVLECNCQDQVLE